MTPTAISSHLLRSRLGKICVAIAVGTAEEMLARATEVLKETTFIELRLDYLPDPAAAIEQLKPLLGEHTEATVIATCRCQSNGGRFQGSSEQALEVLLSAAVAGFQLVDLELESAEQLPVEAVDRLRSSGAALVLSHHDFEATRDLDAVLARMKKFAPEFLKIVPTAQTLGDNITLMRFLERESDNSNGSIVGICMGESGIISRVLGLRAGSAFTFAAAHAGEETAPGQIAARTLLETYRIDQVDAATKVYGVAGNPIGRSLSPLMMNTAFRRETVNAVYLALQSSDAQDVFKLLREVPLQGLSVTMPLKQSIMPLLERTDALSTKVGAVNTVFRAQDGKFYGFNTDVAGIVTPLERRLPIAGLKVLVLGAGGAGRAAVFGLKDKGADVYILNRTPETGAKLAKQAGAKTIKRDAVARAGFDLILNTTPVGMGGSGELPLLEPEDVQCRLVFDIVYNPIETPLIRLARQRGIPFITGVEMFVHQGARQFEIWTGKPAPIEEMMKVVLHSLRPADGDSSSGPAILPQSAPMPDAGAVEEDHDESVEALGAPHSEPVKKQTRPKTPASAKTQPAQTEKATPAAKAVSAEKAEKAAGSAAPAVKPMSVPQAAVKTVPVKAAAKNTVPAKPGPAKAVAPKAVREKPVREPAPAKPAAVKTSVNKKKGV